ncbi:hypothetical protein FPCIR_6259 [Fusarium pseudocircinatum]|uniref:Uncharacterized protein n=1 Tax=Fusarium pseudocircinatum TaxID=56676 RepID=A0A8H5LFY7_9HYPO|nr:hypothetical protein FPCIR_6259 [Fusarium pseudocircinatum]
MDKDKKESPGAEGHKLTRFGSTGKATFQSTNPSKFDYMNLSPETITVADVHSIPDNLLEKVALAMDMNSNQLFVKAIENQRRMAVEEGKLNPTDIIYTKADIPRLVAVSEFDEHTIGDNERDTGVHEEGATQRETASDQPSIESTIEEREDEFSAVQGGVEQDVPDSHVGGQGQIQPDHPALKKYEELENLISRFYDEKDKGMSKEAEFLRPIVQKVRKAWIAFRSGNSEDWRKELPSPCEMILARFIHPRGCGSPIISGLTQAMGISAKLDIMHTPENDERISEGDSSSMSSGPKETTERLDATCVEQIRQEQANLRNRVAILETAVLERLVTDKIYHSAPSDKTNGSVSKATETRPANVAQIDSSVTSSGEPTKNKSNSIPQDKGSDSIASSSERPKMKSSPLRQTEGPDKITNSGKPTSAKSSSIPQNKGSSIITAPTSKATKNKFSPLRQTKGSDSVASSSSKAPNDKLRTVSKSNSSPVDGNGIIKMLGSAAKKRGRLQDGEEGGGSKKPKLCDNKKRWFNWGN